jgi:hypothetical protein
MEAAGRRLDEEILKWKFAFVKRDFFFVESLKVSIFLAVTNLNCSLIDDHGFREETKWIFSVRS